MGWYDRMDENEIEAYKAELYTGKRLCPDPHKELPEEELVTEDEFITMMTGK